MKRKPGKAVRWRAACAAVLSPLLHCHAAAQQTVELDSPCLVVAKGKVKITYPDGTEKMLEPWIPPSKEDAPNAPPEPRPAVATLTAGSGVEALDDGEDENTNGRYDRDDFRFSRLPFMHDPTSGSIVLERGTKVESTDRGTVAAEKQKSTLAILKGSLYLNIDGKKLKGMNPPREFRLRTPTNIIAVRGTKFGMEINGAETFINKLEGSIDLLDLNGVKLGECETVMNVNEDGKIGFNGPQDRDSIRFARGLQSGCNSLLHRERVTYIEPDRPKVEIEAFDTRPQHKRSGSGRNPKYVKWERTDGGLSTPGGHRFTFGKLPEAETPEYLIIQLPIKRSYEFGIVRPRWSRPLLLLQVRATKPVRLTDIKAQFEREGFVFSGSHETSEGPDFLIGGDNTWHSIGIPLDDPAAESDGRIDPHLAFALPFIPEAEGPGDSSKPVTPEDFVMEIRPLALFFP